MLREIKLAELVLIKVPSIKVIRVALKVMEGWISGTEPNGKLYVYLGCWLEL